MNSLVKTFAEEYVFFKQLILAYVKIWTEFFFILQEWMEIMKNVLGGKN